MRRVAEARIIATVAVLALVAAACGPRERVHVGMRDYATNVVYGGQTKAAPKAVPNASLEPSFPSFIQPLITSASPSVLPGAKPAKVVADCPSAGFSVPARYPVTPNVPAPPKSGAYRIRQDGYVSIGGVTTQPAQDAARVVQNVVKNADGTFTFDVIDAQPSKALTQTTYLVDQRTGVPGSDGIYFTQVVSKLPDGTIDAFTPADPIRLISLPADPSNPQFASAGTDGVHNITMSLTGTIKGHGRVDACGTVLDSWEVSASGHILSPTKNISFTTVYDIGTHFGGLVLADQLGMSGTDQGVAVAPSNGAQCTGGNAAYSTANTATTTTLVQPAPCPGVVLSRDTRTAFGASPPVVKQ